MELPNGNSWIAALAALLGGVAVWIVRGFMVGRKWGELIGEIAALRREQEALRTDFNEHNREDRVTQAELSRVLQEIRSELGELRGARQA